MMALTITYATDSVIFPLGIVRPQTLTLTPPSQLQSWLHAASLPGVVKPKMPI